MKNLIVCLLLASLFAGCGKGNSVGPSGPAGPAGSVVTSSSPTDIQNYVASINSQRQKQGQSVLVQGLTCTLYTVPTTTTLIIGATLTTVASFSYTGNFDIANQSVSTGFTVLPSALANLYQSWFIVKCTGNMVVLSADYYEFDLTSDDGANFYNSSIVVNNDGLHGAQTKSGVRFLSYGLNSIELDFLQAGGNQALQLYSGGVAVPASMFYH